MLNRVRLTELLSALPKIRIGVLGDFCLDAYWQTADEAAELSIETGLKTRPVRSQRYELGAAGTIVNNLLAMGVGQVEAFGVVGSDPFGRELLRLLEVKGVTREGVMAQATDWNTPVYIKPITNGREESRWDFGGFNGLSDETGGLILHKLEQAMGRLDAVIVNQQFPNGIHTPVVQWKLNELFRRQAGKIFVVDGRQLSGAYANCIHKVNDLEAARLSGADRQPGEAVPLEETRLTAQQLFEKWKQPVFVTRGARGCLVVTSAGEQLIPGLQIVRPVDMVGAGDSFLAGMTAALAAEFVAGEAAEFGNFVAGVTVQKLFETGTATPAEILEIGAEPDYVFEPELAENFYRAKFWKDKQIEIVGTLPPRAKVRHALLDYDGTISTVRQGWEQVMEAVMVTAVLGRKLSTAGEVLREQVTKRVQMLIESTTGKQTLTQMRELIRLIGEFGFVPLSEVKTEEFYKKIYLEALTRLIGERLKKLNTGELSVDDLTIEGAPAFLRRLREAGVKLHLASGTDQTDMIAEMQALGLAELFEGRIHGAIGDVGQDVKRSVVEGILREIGDGDRTALIAVGDGPVEMREVRKRGGLTVGVASDEVRRYGWNLSKRGRLIRAGAQIVVPDFSQQGALSELLESK